ncbi:MAG: T9SS type A sorting domain-containing protein [Chitinophagaceae bacterium]
MNKFFTQEKFSLSRTLIFFALISNIWAGAQSLNELKFENAVLRSGQAGADNAVYTFPQVKNNIDALVKIAGRSSSLVTLSSIDLTSTGFNKSFQPQVKYNGGSVTSASNWWIEFEIKFVNANTSSPAVIDSVFVSGLDIDGDNSTLKEFNTFYEGNGYILENNSKLSMNLVTGTIAQLTSIGNKFLGTVTEHSGIDTLAKDIMITKLYKSVNTITIRVGGVTTGSSADTDRMHSIWFRNFTYNAPFSTLPVKLTSFTASLNNNKADLKWTTANEINVSHFVVEKSTDGTNFNDAGIVFAYGNETSTANYSFTDNLSAVQSGIVYYRLRSVDIDGKSMYSETRIIRISRKTENTISIDAFPNPAINVVNITLPTAWQNKKIYFEVLNLTGQVTIRTVTSNPGQNEKINVSNISPGMYIIKASCGGEIAQQKFVKQ